MLVSTFYTLLSNLSNSVEVLKNLRKFTRKHTFVIHKHLRKFTTKHTFVIHKHHQKLNQVNPSFSDKQPRRLE